MKELKDLDEVLAVECRGKTVLNSESETEERIKFKQHQDAGNGKKKSAEDKERVAKDKEEMQAKKSKSSAGRQQREKRDSEPEL